MKTLATYDLMESFRLSNELLGATAKTYWSYPAFGLVPHPAPASLAAWGSVTERSFSRIDQKPDWGIDMTVTDGKEYFVEEECAIEKPFCELIYFNAKKRPPASRKLLLIAPMSGHYATLLRRTVTSLLPDCDLYVTEWRNARDIPVSVGKFDIEDFTLYLAEFMQFLGSETHVIAVCQPAPLALAATAHLAAKSTHAQPRSLILIGGPVVPDAAPTEVTDFGRRMSMGQLEHLFIQHVGVNHAGAGRLVYPGVLQLASFMSMNLPTHFHAFRNQVTRAAKGKAADHDRHNSFYDEYLAVMDLTAEFYLSTVERIFKRSEIARNCFTLGGQPIDLGLINRTAIKTVEGGKDDISAPGQCSSALDLLTGVPDQMKASHIEPDAGHYGIFAGKTWHRNIRPLVLDFIDEHNPKSSNGSISNRSPFPNHNGSPIASTI